MKRNTRNGRKLLSTVHLLCDASLGGLLLLGLIGFTNVGDWVYPVPGAFSQSASGERMATQQEQPSTTQVDARMVAANNTFGFKLYVEAIKHEPGTNVFLSPFSVALALAMTYNGAEGETKLAMARTLELQDLSLEEVNRANAALKASLAKPDPQVQLEIANSLWAKRGLAFRPEFITSNRDYYGADVTELDFRDPAAPAMINAWVNDKTRDKIPTIIDRIDRDSILVLINAIYFKGKWAKEFDRTMTHEQPFTLPDGKQKNHPMMRQSGAYPYHENERFQAVSLPYGGGRLSMYIFLPAQGTSLDDFRKSLNTANWNAWMSRFERTSGEIVLPRFHVEYEAELNEALKALGMNVAFDGARASLGGMIQASENAFINQVKHKTFAEVNEEGTEAAAVTSGEVSVTSAMQQGRSFHMVVDRPFFCAIRDNQTAVILFMGSISDPR